MTTNHYSLNPQSFVYNTDCMPYLQALPDKAYDLAICDIPYGINVANMPFTRERKTTVKQKNGTRLSPHRNKHHHTPKDWDLNPPPQIYFDQLRRVTTHQIIFGAHYANWSGSQDFGTITWHKGVPDGLSFSKTEQAFCSLVPKGQNIDIHLLWNGMRQAYTLKDPLRQQGNKALNERRIHPCHKPILLYKALLDQFSKPGDFILDTHLGSGSSRIAAHQLNRNFLGLEIDPQHFNDHIKRWGAYISQQIINFPSHEEQK